MKSLSVKIEESISLIKKGEQLALSLNPDGYFVGFSGGKDSQVWWKSGKTLKEFLKNKRQLSLDFNGNF